MITHPISNRDLMRSVMFRIKSAGVRYTDPVLQVFAEDEDAGLCSMRIRKLPEHVEWVEIIDGKGLTQLVKQTTQQHEVVVEYYEPELEFMKLLSI